MKKRLGMFIMSAFLIGTLTGCDVSVGVRHPDEVQKDSGLNNNVIEDIDEKVKIEELNRINISMNFAKIDIVQSDSNEVEIVSKSNSNVKTKINIEKDKDLLNIEEEKNKVAINSSNRGREISIKIPKQYKGDVTLNYGAGEVHVSDVSMNNFKINGGAGELSIDKAKFNNMELNQGVGESNINLEEKCGDIVINGGVGEINLTMEEVGGNLRYKGGVGEANISIPKNSPVYFQTKSGIGSCDVKAITSGENKYLFDLLVSIGSVTVNNSI